MDGHRLTSYDTSLVESGGVNCGRRRRNVYDKKPRRYAKNNRTAHLTARNDKSVAYTAKTDFLEQISNANLRFFIHPNFAFLSGPNKVDLRGISKLIEVK